MYMYTVIPWIIKIAKVFLSMQNYNIKIQENVRRENIQVRIVVFCNQSKEWFYRLIEKKNVVSLELHCFI